jgi:hypothetical protein
LKSPPNNATNFSSVLSKRTQYEQGEKEKKGKRKKLLYLTYCQFRHIRFELIFCPKIFRISLPPASPIIPKNRSYVVPFERGKE